MEDETLSCSDCNEDFIFTVGEQEFFQERNFDAPRRCKECRDKRKAERNNSGFGRF
ncbi:MAG: zinc-ribbon domain-containing protein [Methanosarcinales archaeon]|nr:zinc-ribbon domain-containing protein [Methanosarcinales archaeon]